MSVRRRLFVLAALIAVATVAGTAQKRTGLMGDLIADVTDVEGKIVGLAKAMPEGSYAWRPMPGVRSVGEAFTHELVHLVLAAYGSARTRHRFVEEGVATWLGGGSRTPRYRGYVQLLARYQATNPDATLRDLLSTFGGDDSPFYASGALVADAVFQRHGLEGIRRLLTIGPSNDALFAALPGLLGIGPDTLEQWWRAQPSRILR